MGALICFAGEISNDPCNAVPASSSVSKLGHGPELRQHKLAGGRQLSVPLIPNTLFSLCGYGQAALGKGYFIY
jgi:hypothetical protein